MKRIKTWTEFLEVTGGSKPLAIELGLERHTVLSWLAERRGIPVKYWPRIIERWGLTPRDLYTVDLQIKALPL
jgi:hypothetical protein